MAKDYYQILGISKTATADEIKKAFHKKAHEHHPDKQGGNAEKFKELSEAYQVLSHPDKRKRYDQFGSAFSGGAGSGGFNWSDFANQANQGGFNASGFRSGSFDFSDLGDIFSDFFGSGFSRASQRQDQRRTKGADLAVNLVLTLAEAVFGAKKNLEIFKEVVCQRCQGTALEPGAKLITCKTCGGQGQVTVSENTFFGAFRSAAVCPDCDGAGKIPEKKCGQCHGRGAIQDKEAMTVTIPAGIADGETLKISGKGGAGSKGARSGDLYLNIQVLPHADFKRSGDNLLTKKIISFSQAALGDKVRVKTLNGEVVLKIPAGTPSGQQFTLKGQGAGRLRGRGRGDLLVEVKVAVPKNLSREQKKLIEELAREGL